MSIREVIKSQIFTGIEYFDNITKGMENGEVIIIGGRPGTGKTNLALKIATSLSLNQTTGLCFYSLELSGKQLTRRMESEDRINLLKQPKDYFFICDSEKIDSRDIESDLKKMISIQTNIKVVIIDYTQLLIDCEKTELWNTFKRIAVKEQIVFLILSQLNKDITYEQIESNPLSCFFNIKPDEDMVDHMVFLFDGRITIRSLC